MKRLALLLYLLLIPLTFPYLGVEGIKVTLRMAWTALTGRRRSILPHKIARDAESTEAAEAA